MKVLIELSRLDFETLEPETIRLCGKMDWDEFLRLAVKQKVMLVIEKNLDIFINNNPQVHIPYVYLMKIRVLSKGLRDRLKAIDDEIERLFQIFNHNHLKVVLFKGASMKKIYGEEYFRIYNDIDLLVDLYDVERIHDILLQHQYIYDSDEIVNGKILEEKCRQVFNCIGNYIRISEGITLKIDLHKADCYNTWNLQDFYKGAVKEVSGIYNFGLVDGFIFSCYHAWHHYPRVVCIRLGSYLASLKDYMDIREFYLYIKRMGLLTHLYRRIRLLDCDTIVNNMLYLTERLYGTFCERKDVVTCEPTVENDHMDSLLTSYFERRLFYPKQERELLKVYYSNKNTMSVLGEFLESAFFDKRVYDEYNNELFWNAIHSYYSQENIFFDEPYGTIIRKNFDFSFCFSLGWNEEDLIIKIDISDKFPFWGQEDFYNPIQDCIKFIFNDDWNKVFTLQIKSNGRHAMFIDNKGDVLRLKRVEENVTYFNTKEGGYSVITSIPWEYTGIIPKKMKKHIFILT